MLALGTLIVHVAFETRVGSRSVPLFWAPKSGEVEFTVVFGSKCVVLKMLT